MKSVSRTTVFAAEPVLPARGTRRFLARRCLMMPQPDHNVRSAVALAATPTPQPVKPFTKNPASTTNIVRTFKFFAFLECHLGHLAAEGGVANAVLLVARSLPRTVPGPTRKPSAILRGRLAILCNSLLGG